MALGPIDQRKLERDGAPVRLHAELTANNQRLDSAVRSIYPDARVIYFLSETPGQYEDYFTVLVDDRFVVELQLDRLPADSPPHDVETETVEAVLRRTLRGRPDPSIRLAVLQARRDLATEFGVDLGVEAFLPALMGPGWK